RDGAAMILRASVTAQPSSPEANKAEQAVLKHVRTAAHPPGLRADVTGPVAVLADQTKAIDDSVARTHLLALGLIVVILIWVYRSPVAMLVPLATIGAAYAVSLTFVSLLARAGMQVSAMYQTFSVVVIFGIGTDYCLLLVSRYAEELRASTDGEGTDDEPELRVRTLTGTVAVLATVLASSAATVAVGFSAQGLARFGLYRTLGRRVPGHRPAHAERRDGAGRPRGRRQAHVTVLARCLQRPRRSLQEPQQTRHSVVGALGGHAHGRRASQPSVVGTELGSAGLPPEAGPGRRRR